MKEDSKIILTSELDNLQRQIKLFQPHVDDAEAKAYDLRRQLFQFKEKEKSLKILLGTYDCMVAKPSIKLLEELGIL